MNTKKENIDVANVLFIFCLVAAVVCLFVFLKIGLTTTPQMVYGSTVLFPTGGGTGTSTAPTANQLLIGNADGTYSPGNLVLASTTIGNGTQVGGLTVSGGATTTGNAFFNSNVGIGLQPSASNELNVLDTLFVDHSPSGGSVKLASGNSTGEAGIILTGYNSSHIGGITWASGVSGRVFQFKNTSASGVGPQYVDFGPPATGSTNTYLLGINATSTPSAHLSIAATAGGTVPLLMLSTTTASTFATSTAFQIDANGNVLMGAFGNTLQIGQNTATTSGGAITLSSVLSQIGAGSVGTSTGLDLYNTIDQSTNFERGQIGWTGNNFTVQTSSGGSGIQRQLRLSSVNNAGSGSVLTFQGGSATQGQIEASRPTSATNFVLFSIDGTPMTQSSTIFKPLLIDPGMSQTGSAGYSLLTLDGLETTIGTGAKNLQVWQASTTAISGSNVIGDQIEGVWTNAGQLSVGSSSPFAQFTIATNPGADGRLTTLFQIASSTASATTSLWRVDNIGHISASSTAPTLSSCGTNPFMTGDDSHGYVTVGSVAATGCTITFARAYLARPECTLSNESMSVVNAMTYTVSASAIVVTQTGLTGDVLDYQCEGF